MKTETDKIIKKFEDISLRYHYLSILVHELGQSIRIELKKKNINPNSKKQIKEYLKTLNIDFEKLKNYTQILERISIREVKK